jgi:hypothetical protein
VILGGSRLFTSYPVSSDIYILHQPVVYPSHWHNNGKCVEYGKYEVKGDNETTLNSRNLNQLKHHNVSAAYKAIERDSEISFLGSPELLER